MQQRGAAIIKARKFSSALSAASSACDHIRDWVLGTPEVCGAFSLIFNDILPDVDLLLILNLHVGYKGFHELVVDFLVFFILHVGHLGFHGRVL